MSVAGSVYSASPSYGRPSSPGSVIGTSSTFSGYKSGRRGSVEMSTAARLHKYIRRIFRRDQMDFEFALWQAVYLIINPQVVYRNFHYRKQTKNQYARDDPAFLVLVSVFLSFTSGMRWQMNQDNLHLGPWRIVQVLKSLPELLKRFFSSSTKLELFSSSRSN